jgi:hypothetical protein
MPKISDYYSAGSGTLKAADIGDGLEATIIGHRHHKFDNQEKPTLFLKLEDEEKEFRCGWNNMQRLAEMYGEEIDDWIGKTIELLPDKYRDNRTKEMKDTITVRVRKAARNAPKAAVKHDDRNPPPPLDDEIPF